MLRLAGWKEEDIDMESFNEAIKKENEPMLRWNRDTPTGPAKLVNPEEGRIVGKTWSVNSDWQAYYEPGNGDGESKHVGTYLSRQDAEDALMRYAVNELMAKRKSTKLVDNLMPYSRMFSPERGDTVKVVLPETKEQRALNVMKFIVGQLKLGLVRTQHVTLGDLEDAARRYELREAEKASRHQNFTVVNVEVDSAAALENIRLANEKIAAQMKKIREEEIGSIVAAELTRLASWVKEQANCAVYPSSKTALNSVAFKVDSRARAFQKGEPTKLADSALTYLKWALDMVEGLLPPGPPISLFNFSLLDEMKKYVKERSQ
jgi:hypothetical protein